MALSVLRIVDSSSEGSEVDWPIFGASAADSPLWVRFRTVWRTAAFDWMRGDPDASWLEWCRAWERQHCAIIVGLFANRVFRPTGRVKGRWVLQTPVCHCATAEFHRLPIGMEHALVAGLLGVLRSGGTSLPV